MRYKTAQKRIQVYSDGFAPIPLLVIVTILALSAVITKTITNSHILGESTNSAPPPQSAPAPQTQSQPQQQQPQQNQQPSQPQQQPSNNQPGQPGSQPQQQQGQQPPQQNPQNYQPRSTQEQQQFKQYDNQQGNFGQQGNNRPGNPAGNNQGPPNGNFNGNQQGPNNQQTFSPQEQQKFHQIQQQFEQQAAKAGFQINGNLPSQYLQFQSNSNSSNQDQQNQNSQGGFRIQALPSIKDFPSIQGNFNVNSINGKPVNLNDGNTRIHLGSNNSNLSLEAVKADGTKFQIDKKAFETISSAIKLETGSDVTQSGDNFAIKRGLVEAATKFPISFDTTTKTFSVQTKNGEQEVKILPDQAVQKLLENKFFSHVQDNTSGDSKSSSEPKITLTEFNNQPAYEVRGIADKKVFGFIPVSIPKTTFVSAQTGDTLTTNESFVSRVLETLSFGQ